MTPPPMATPKLLLAPTTPADYVKHRGIMCPYCSSPDITGDSWDSDHGYATQEVSCNVCDGKWLDEYQLTGYVPEVEPEGNQTPEVHKLIVLSTAHLSESGRVSMEGLAGESRHAGPGMYADPIMYGWLLTLADIDDEDEEYITPELKDIRRYADAHGATLVRLDADGPIIGAIPHYKHK